MTTLSTEWGPAPDDAACEVLKMFDFFFPRIVSEKDIVFFSYCCKGDVCEGEIRGENRQLLRVFKK